MAKSSNDRRGKYRAAMANSVATDKAKASNYGHLLLPRGVNVFKEEGNTTVRLDVLPYYVTDKRHPDRNDEYERATEGEIWYRRPYKLHRQIGAGKTSVVCLGARCPICEYRSKLMTEEKRDWKDPLVSALRASDRFLYYVVPLGVPKYEKKPYIWDISGFCFQDSLNAELGENDDFFDFWLPEDGLTLKVRFSEETMGQNKYAKTSRIDFEKRDYVYAENVLKELGSLDDVLDVKSYAEVEAIFYDTDGAEPEDDGKDRSLPKETRRAESLTTPKKAVEEPEEEVEEETAVEPEAPKAVERPKAAAKAKEPTKPAAVEGECPHGYEFGADNDEKPECAECPVWAECLEAKEAA